MTISGTQHAHHRHRGRHQRSGRLGRPDDQCRRRPGRGANLDRQQRLSVDRGRRHQRGRHGRPDPLRHGHGDSHGRQHLHRRHHRQLRHLATGQRRQPNGSVTGNILNNAALVFANATTLAYAGSITGSGGVTVAGPARSPSAATTATGAAPRSAAAGWCWAMSTPCGSSGGLVLAGGSLNLADYSVAVPSISLTGGTLTGSGQTLTISGSGPIDAESGAASANWPAASDSARRPPARCCSPATTAIAAARPI